MRLVPRSPVPDSERLVLIGTLIRILKVHAKKVDLYPGQRDATLAKYERALDLLRTVQSHVERCAYTASRADLDALGDAVTAFAQFVVVELAPPRRERGRPRANGVRQ